MDVVEVDEEGGEALGGLDILDGRGGDMVDEEVVLEIEDDNVANREVTDTEDGFDDESENSEDERERRNMAEICGRVEVVLEREDIWKVGNDLRALTEEEKAVLGKFKSLVINGEKLVVPSLKTIDKNKLKEKVKQVKGLMHNIIKENMSITEVNRVLLVGGYLVAEGLGKVKKSEVKKKEKGKPYWQRRVERNIVDWRKDLGRVEEMRKG